MIGHEDKLDLLLQAAARARLAQAYLISGARGVGKATFAKTLAQRLVCLSPQGSLPCNDCAPCQQVAANTHPDLTWVGLLPEKTELGIDQVRELKAVTSIEPLGAGPRVVVIDGADVLTAEAANALLKVLEEPLARTLFLLLASQERGVLPTVRSRCVLLHLAPVPESVGVSSLLERSVSADVAELAWRESGGIPGLALEIAENVELRERKQTYAELFAAVLSGSGWQRLQQYVEQEYGSGSTAEERASIRAGELAANWLGLARDLVVLKLGLNSLSRYAHRLSGVATVLESRGLPQLLRICREIVGARRALSANANVRLTIESLAFNLARI